MRDSAQVGGRWLLLGAALLLGAGCPIAKATDGGQGDGGTDGGIARCNELSKCSADAPPTQAQIDSCRAYFMSPSTKCWAENITLSECFRDKRVCNASGTTDDPATKQACAAETNAYVACGP